MQATNPPVQSTPSKDALIKEYIKQIKDIDASFISTKGTNVTSKHDKTKEPMVIVISVFSRLNCTYFAGALFYVGPENILCWYILFVSSL